MLKSSLKRAGVQKAWVRRTIRLIRALDEVREKAQKLAGYLPPAFCLGEHVGSARDTFYSSYWASGARMFPRTNRDGRFYPSNHFSFMPEKQEMKYVPIGMESPRQRSRGLRLFLRRLLLRLLCHSRVCPACQHEWMNEGREKVIEF